VREFKTPDIQENNVSNKHSDLSERKQHAHLRRRRENQDNNKVQGGSNMTGTICV
jgi:hypothetical protein